MQNLINIKIAFLLIILPNFAFAYVGPGMGGGLIVAVLGIFVAIFLALFGVIYYPIKRMINKKKKIKKIE
tara:strand:+ start:985 stop:1194 length:210 start_codon:yes stop_codon:yes gene_type:complete